MNQTSQSHSTLKQTIILALSKPPPRPFRSCRPFQKGVTPHVCAQTEYHMTASNGIALVQTIATIPELAASLQPLRPRAHVRREKLL